MIKMKSIFYSIPLLIICLSISACGGGSTDSSGEPEVAEQMTSVLVIGDSLSTGFGLATPWPNRLANILGVSVDNSFSEDGVETSFALGYIESALTTVMPSHVVILFGTNDAIRGSVNDAINNLQEMIRIANQQNVTVIIGTLPIITRSSSENARAAEISDAIRSFSGARIADIRPALGDGFLVDGVHPNNAGQQIIADTIAAQF
ncbi:MAG: hypothetical protein KTR16_11010 [Acidiferrobacterales bacterium]|nr:hypothetical protein [Acidiferrobacterales bacterium]